MKDMLTWFGLKKYPFDKDINALNSFESNSLKECTARLQYMKRRGGIMMLTGDPGVGKTLAIRRFISTLNESNFRCEYTPLATLEPSDLFRHINDKLGLPKRAAKSALFQQIQKEIIELREQRGKTLMLTIDEAHLLKAALLQEIRIITNFKMDSFDPFILILSGQSDLLRLMEYSIMEPLAQRLTMRYHMLPLSHEEVTSYINHHMNLAGALENFFSQNAVNAIFEITYGIPRRVGSLAELALNYATFAQKKNIDADDIIKIKSGI